MQDHLKNHIIKRLKSQKNELRILFNDQNSKIKHLIIDDLFPEEVAMEIYNQLPKNEDDYFTRKSLKEHKTVGIATSQYAPLINEAIFSFQDQEVVRLIEEITGLPALEADPELYASGISKMSKGNFLNPHLDNSHNKDRNLYRVLNLLYYATPHWQSDYGGNLELWENGIQTDPVTIPPLFNRLVIMKTDAQSLHSVSKVNIDKSRVCISNYYFSPSSPEAFEYRHVTSFRARRGEMIKDLMLRIDTFARNTFRKFYKKQHTRHIKK